MEPHIVLIVDDEPDMAEMIKAHFRQQIESEQYTFFFAHNGDDALMLLKAYPEICLILADINMPGMDGLTMLKTIRQESYADDRFKWVKVIMVSAYDDMPNIREAMHGGAVDFLAKPIDFGELKKVIGDTLHEIHTLQEAEQFIGNSEPIRQLKEKIRQISKYSVNVLIEGETGTGKSLLAKVIHHCSCRRDGPFVDLHCGAIPSPLIESELFGHVKGAFTGADRQRTGKFQLADSGTLFLDEINTIEPDIQVKLLKAIEEQTFFPVGSDSAVQVDVRIIAASNIPLLDLVRAKQFRKDLYYRLNIVMFTVPPLCDRKSDIPLLVKHFLERFNRKHYQHKSISRGTLEKLMYAPWKGNIRELANVLEKALLFAPHDVIKIQDISWENLYERSLSASGPESPAAVVHDKVSIEAWIEHLLSEELDVMNTLYGCLLQVAWRYYRGNKTMIAKRLGMARGTLYRLLQDHQIE